MPHESGGISEIWDSTSTAEVQQVPSQEFLTFYMGSLCCTALLCCMAIGKLRKKEMRRMLRQDIGVALKKVTKTAREIERKSFHLAGLIVPCTYQVLLRRGWSKNECMCLAWSVFLLGGGADLLRTKVRIVHEYWPGRKILRQNEISQLSGATSFALGCCICMHFFAPAIAMTAIIFHVMGDMSAALIGRSFGQSICSLKIGPNGRKSIEGSSAMFVVCVTFGCTIFSEVYLREYAIVLAALAATFTELLEPMGLNDNLTVPTFTSIVLTLGFARTYSCDSSSNPLQWYRTTG